MVAKPPQSTRGNKGRVNLDRLAVQRAKGIKKDVDFNDLGQPIGASGAEMQSYIGVLARERAKVSFKLWRDVPQEVKNTIWDSIKLTFNVDDQWKKGCMESANTKWRQWKTYLYNKHIVPFVNKPHMLYCPPSDSGILAEDWKNFVMSRLSVEFQWLKKTKRKALSASLEKIKEELMLKASNNFTVSCLFLVLLMFCTVVSQSA